MFHKIPNQVLNRMAYLENIDRRDRNDGTERLERLRQIPPDTGRFIALLAASSPEGNWIEIGTSAGYSALWLSLACKARRQKLITYEILEEKHALALETFGKTGTTDWVELVKGDACVLLEQMDGISFCFLDAEKEVGSRL